MRHTLALFVIALLLFSATNYGGIRSPDGELVFRVGESIAGGRGFEVGQRLELWEDFGVAKGRGNRLYAIFGPLESIVAAPGIRLASLINESRWYEHAGWLPVSLYAGNGLIEYLEGVTPKNREPHALRFLVSFLNSLLTALACVVFWMTARLMVRSSAAATLATALLASGTLLWPYSGTFFSEPLAMLLVLSSFALLAAADPAFRSRAVLHHGRNLFLSGLCLALAASAHLTAVLFVPFFIAYCGRVCLRGAGARRVSSFLLFCTGCALALFFLGAYNLFRFGSMFETGRSVHAGNLVTTDYSRFVAPWRGLWGLLVSPGKGLLLLCPAIMAGLLSWRSFHRRHALLSYILGAALLARLVFIAARSDWHGGFSLGPRYMVMAIPFCVLPVLFWLQEQVDKRRLRRLGLFAAFAVLCASQQLYFSLGEIFSCYQTAKFKYASLGINIFKDNRLYLDWEFSPLANLVSGKLGPFWLHSSSAGVGTVWLIGSVLLAAAAAAGFIRMSRHLPQARKRNTKTAGGPGETILD
ncbi:MAG: hypothetical protein HY770_02750 [Chitinivibrionia bacterium]|nr:hypothetical protein [Chitinivibrionia bacterium]